MQPKVSVIIPVYNVEKYLRECLDSVINQTLKDIEIICVNDGSTDNSLEILREYEKQDSRIKIIDKKNEGAGAARNLGLKSAHGEYIIFFDSDDYMDITALEKLYQNITDTNADISICKSYEFHDGEENKRVMDYAIKNQLIDNKSVFSPQEVNKYIFQFCIGWPWDKLYRREFVLKNGLLFQNLHHSNDTRFVLLSLACANKISIIKDCLVNHRWHKTSLEKTRINCPDSYYHALISLMKNLKQKNLYKLYEQSFVNYCITFPLWHITSINNDFARSIMEKHLNKLLKKKVKINNYNENYFYDPKAYSQILEILNFLSIKNKNKIKQIFSVHNDDRKTHKIITILGMKFKFRRKKLVPICQVE